MCKFNISIDDAIMEKVRPTIAKGMDENPLRISQRLRGIGHAPKDFDYKKELEERF